MWPPVTFRSGTRCQSLPSDHSVSGGQPKPKMGMQKQEPIRQVSANPTSEAGILGL